MARLRQSDLPELAEEHDFTDIIIALLPDDGQQTLIEAASINVQEAVRCPSAGRATENPRWYEKSWSVFDQAERIQLKYETTILNASSNKRFTSWMWRFFMHSPVL